MIRKAEGLPGWFVATGSWDNHPREVTICRPARQITQVAQDGKKVYICLDFGAIFSIAGCGIDDATRAVGECLAPTMPGYGEGGQSD